MIEESTEPGRPQGQPARIAISPDGRALTRAGQPWLLVADTIWSAFTNVPEPEWAPYVSHRAAQGFSSLLISVLPILNDMSDAGPAMPEPFPGFWSGSPRFGRLAPAYVDHARAKLRVAAAHGLVPSLALLWCAYAPGAWASARDPRFVIPVDVMPEVLASMVEAFDDFAPVYLVSGDTDFRQPETTDWYTRAIAYLRELVPDAVTTLHTNDETFLPAEVAADPGLGFYSYQSGHRLEWQHHTWEFAEHYVGQPVRRPVINLEPCYEGHGHGFRYGRFSAADIRHATWQSLLAGASAGIGYGAHGIWQWQRPGMPFNNPAFSSMPFDRRVALGFQGASDVGFAARLVEQLGLIGAEARQDLLVAPPPGVRAALSTDGSHLLVYVPHAVDVRLAPAVVVADAVAWDLGRAALSDVELGEGDGPVIGQVPWNGDALISVRLGSPVA